MTEPIVSISNQMKICSKDQWMPFFLRTLSALVLSPAALLFVHLGAPLLVFAITVVAVIMAREWARMVERTSGRSNLLALVIAALVLVAGLADIDFGIGLVAVVIVALMFLLGILRDGNVKWGWLALGLMVIAAPSISFIWLRSNFTDGERVIYWLLAVVWMTDTGAFISGRLLGGPRLVPRISPSKTWAGLLGGTFCAAIVGCVTASLIEGMNMSKLMLLSVLVSFVAQAGDLGESYIKRRFGIKDTGRLIPGHGGILDRTDSLLAAVLFVGIISWRAKGIWWLCQ